LLRAFQGGDGALPLMRMVDAGNEACSPLFPESRTLIVDAQAELEARDAEIGRLAGELESARSEAARLAGIVTARDGEIGRLAEELARAEKNRFARGWFSRRRAEH
jgi:hypothetical protein